MEYGKLERGTTKITWEKLIKIAETLQTTPWEIVNFNKAQPFPLSQPAQVIEIGDDVDPGMAQNINSLQERVKYLEQVNELLKKQLEDKSEIIHLLKKELAGQED